MRTVQIVAASVLMTALLVASIAANAGDPMGYAGDPVSVCGPSGCTYTGAVVFNSTTQAATLNTLQLMDPDGDSGIRWTADDAGDLVAGGVAVIDWTSAIIDFNRTARMQARGFVPAKVTADPCAATSNYPEASIFYNDTSNYWCGCDEAGADVKLSDGTACF